MLKKLYRQGEILLSRISKTAVPKTLVRKDNILARGEATGHSHILDNQAEVYRDQAGMQYIVIESAFGSVLSHDEHAAITVPRGTYAVTIQREYDVLRDEVRAIRD